MDFFNNNVMHGERERDKLVDILFLLRILEFKVNYGYCILITCVVTSVGWPLFSLRGSSLKPGGRL